MTKSKKIICIILAGLIAVSAVAGTLFYVFNRYSKSDFVMLNLPVNPDNRVEFRNNVHIADSPSQIQKYYDTVSVNNEEYTIVYENALPNFFRDMQIGEVFCVYPDSNATESFFALGFCGKLTGINENNGKHYVSFTMPELTDIFKDIYINTSVSDKSSVVSTAFYPSEIITNVQHLQTHNAPQTLMCTSVHPIAFTATAAKKTSKSIDESVSYKFKELQSASLLDDYILICEQLKLKFDCKVTDEDGFGIGVSGDVTLEETAVKMLLDYHYDEAEDVVKINDYSLGFITKQKVNLGLSAEQSVGLDDLDFDLSEKIQIIDIEDVTESEKGKIVLGTYLIGLEAALPILQNDTNKVSYLSLGIAVQLSLTGNGELSLKYDIEESGFAQIEVNGNGENTHLIKGYDYPNPITESRKPTDEELSSVPNITSEIKGEANFNLAFGADIGVCILGMIPIKQANNLVEFEIAKSFTEEHQKNESVEVISNNYLLDDNIDSLIISTNSHLKIHLGAKINFGPLKYKVAEMGGSIQLFKDVWYQSPPAIGFSHSQCGFGGVFVGETYSDDELDKSFKAYMKDTDQDSIITSAKDSLFGSLVNAAFNDLDFDPLDIASYLGTDIDNYKFNYYTSGIIYVRNQTNKVVAVFVIGEDIGNISGVHNGLGSSKIEQIYSAPDLSAEVDIKIGSLARSLLDIDWLEDTNLAGNTYYSCDSNEQMDLIYCNDSLKMIIVTEK